MIADGYGNARILEYNRAGKRVREWGTRGSGPGQFNLPHGIAIDEKGTVFVADRENGRIQRFTMDGKYLGEWGSFGKTFSLTVRGDAFYIGTQPRNEPNGSPGWLMKIDKSSGKVLGVVESTGHHSIEALPNGELLTGTRPDKCCGYARRDDCCNHSKRRGESAQTSALCLRTGRVRRQVGGNAVSVPGGPIAGNRRTRFAGSVHESRGASVRFMKTVHISSTAAVVLLISYCAFAQAAFDMLSVEPNVSGGARGAVQMRSDGISGRNVTLKQLLTYAYEFQEPQISGPEWIEKDGFDIIVKSQDRVGTEQLRLTLQKLLADRFKLSSHRETRYIPGYRLVVAKTGAKLRDSKEEEIFNAALSGRPPFKEGFAAIFTNKDLPGFAGIGRPVTDGTGIKGRYWFQLEWRIDSSRPRMDGSSLHAAIQEQLGLELLEENVPAEVLVIDSVAKR